MFFTGWVMVWNISRVYFFLFIIKNIKSNCWIFFSNAFQSSIFDGYFIPFQLYLFIKVLIFDFLCGSLWFFHDLMSSCCILKTLIIFLFRIYFWFFLFYPLLRINTWSLTFKTYLVTFIIQNLSWTEDKIDSPHWCF